MDELDKKLQAVQSEIGCCFYHMKSEEFREDIKQAFIDAGWFVPADKELVQQVVNHRAQRKIDRHAVEVKVPPVEWPPKPVKGLQMTGQEWYDRFRGEIGKHSEFQDAVDLHNALGYTHPILKAAKKAAGIE